jgi:hypothetical protein
MAFSPNLQINEPTPFDPAQTNEWAGTVNGNMAIIDLAVGGTLSLSVAGNSNVILTSTAGATSQSIYGNYVFTGVLTGNIIVFWPNGLGRKFSVQNQCTGGFTLTLAVNNSGSPAGATVVLPATSSPIWFYSDGTNIVQIGSSATNPNFGGTVNAGTAVAVGLGGTYTSAFNATVLANGTLSLSVAPGGGCWAGILTVSSASSANAAQRTQAQYAISARGTTIDGTTILNTADGPTSGQPYTLSYPSAGVIEVTNTSGSTSVISMTWIGANGG